MWKRIRYGKKANSEHPSFSITPSAEPIDHTRHSLVPTLHSASPTQAQGKRRESDRSAISDVHGQLLSSERSSNYQRRRSQDRRDDPLGLHVLHTPEERSVDIIFIHGLGGTSLRTWCLNRDLANLWPQLWLPEETDLSTARILTFGYNAHFSSKKEQAALTIGDFANDLLFRMKYGEKGTDRLGQVPIIVVAHSMGGLVFKKAFIHGHMNEEFGDIISCVKAVLFLATPHRGTDLAEVLNKILTSSVFGHTPKEYVSELARRSPTIDELNETFRHYASKLQIFSFYETLSTNIGPMSFMVLEKESSVLGYPNETPQPLIADHHNVCKFSSTDDPNYASVTGALRSLAATVRSRGTDTGSEEDISHVKALLGLSGSAEEDMATGRAIRKAGTCQQFLVSQKLNDWLRAKNPGVLWVHASPGSGKSISCSALVEHLLESGHLCAYFFFKHGDQQKRSLSYMLRSLAFQMALQLPAYCRILASLAKSGLRLQGSNALSLWKRLYESTLLDIHEETTVFWAIDALDESESSKQIINLLSRLRDFKCLVKVVAFSRPLPTIKQYFQRARKDVAVVDMELPSNEDDIRLFVVEEIEYIPSDDDFKAETVKEITERSQGNFLWASLVLKQIVRCHRLDQVRRVLNTAPAGMDDLYDRMLETISELEMQEDRTLARILFSWAMYAKTPLMVEEFSELYDAELRSVMDLKHTVNHICGQFIVIDAYNRIALVHQSAHEYLRKSDRLPFSLDSDTVHEELFGKCIMALCDKMLRNKISALKVPQFLPYAATSWAFHLEKCSAESDTVLDALVRFFNGPFPLAWIQYLAMSGHLSELITVSRRMATFVRRRKKVETNRPPMLHRLSDISLIEAWSIDLMRIPAKFGSHLSEDPALIYRCIPALSPTSSAIHQKFSESSSVTLSVSGVSNLEWDDCLARVSAGSGKAICLAASALHLAVATDRPRGSITLWDTSLFEEQKILNTGEHIYSLVFNHSSSLLACYGVTWTHVWKLEDWSLILSTKSPHQERAIDFKFNESNTLVVITDLRRIYRLPVITDEEKLPEWKQLDPSLLDETTVPDGMFLSTPSSVSLNSGCTQIAVAYRTFPLSVWSLDPPEMVARLKRKPRQGQGAVNSYTGTNKVVWNPSGTHIVGIYGNIFKWSPTDDSYEEVKGETGVVPHEIQCSPNGLVFITSDVEGTIKIYDFAQMTVIYKLTSEHSINHIYFSPGSLRFYDIRGPFCNIWEPNCLARLADVASERFNDSDSASISFWSDTDDTRSTSISFPASEGHADSKPSITAVATPSNSVHSLAYANEDGDVELFDPVTHARHTLVESLFGIGIEHLAWSSSHNQIAYSLLNGAITIKDFSTQRAHGKLSIAKDIYVEKRSSAERGRAYQLIFSGDDKKLFINGSMKAQVISLPDGRVLAELSVPEGKCARWGKHYSNPDHLLCLSIDSIEVYTWALEKQHEISLNLPPSPTSPRSMDTLFSSHSPYFILIRTVKFELNRPRYESFILSTTTADNAKSNENPAAAESIPLSPEVAKSIAHPIGILPNNRFVFLDRHLWVCTTHLQEMDGAVRRHFFIPHEWVTNSDLHLCQLLADGTIVCPSRGEVAMLHSDSISEW
ncbi:WD40-repeat-containing domain protein [Biscogniauxia sp. FL1348]|nr:WD40-repeat-containing domain protein [Biscogniauxia sp. FL1348]